MTDKDYDDLLEEVMFYTYKNMPEEFYPESYEAEEDIKGD